MNSISPEANLATNVKVGQFTIIEPNVEVGEGTIIGNNVTIHADSVIGRGVRIDDNTVIGKKPMRAATSANPDSGSLEPAWIGDSCIIGTHVIIYRGCELGESCMVADQATVRENVTVGKKTIVGRNAAIENHCNIGNYCKLETNSYITAWSQLGNYVFVAPGAITTNDNFAGRGRERYKHIKGVIVHNGGRIGANATVLPGKTIEEQGFAAAGSVVTKDVPAKTIVVGSPARAIRSVPEDQLLKLDEVNGS